VAKKRGKETGNRKYRSEAVRLNCRDKNKSQEKRNGCLNFDVELTPGLGG
jgi:hypothetical protein